MCNFLWMFTAIISRRLTPERARLSARYYRRGQRALRSTRSLLPRAVYGGGGGSAPTSYDA